MANNANLIANCERLLDTGEQENIVAATSVFRSVFLRAYSQTSEAARKSQNELILALASRPDVLESVVASPYGSALLPTPEAWLPGVSILSCCMDRNDLLVESMKSWIVIEGVDEIVVLDWSSRVPVSYSLETAGIKDARIRVVRVEGEARWMASHAWNLAFRTVRYETVLKIDCDVVVVPNFLANHSLAGNDFLAGNWRNAKPGQTHINGLVLIQAEDFLLSKGYDERIVTYGWEDDEFYDRLTDGGMRRFDPKQDSLVHLDHADTRRTNLDKAPTMCAWQEIETDSWFWLSLNRRLTFDRNPWPDGKEMSDFEVISGADEELLLRRAEPFSPDIRLIGTHYERVLCAIETLKHRHDCKGVNIRTEDVERLFPRFNLADCMTLLGIKTGKETLWSPPVHVFPPRYRLLIDARYGLGNRMRAIASAAVFAKMTGRKLEIYWEQDHHCDCTFDTLFAGDYPLISSLMSDDYKTETDHFIDLMDIDGGTSRHKVIDLPDHTDLWVRSAFTLLYPNQSREMENQYLRSLTPSLQVSRLLEGLPKKFDVAAHVRMQGSEAAGSVEADARGERSDEEHDTIDSWRAKSHYDAFIKRLDSLVDEGAGSIFLASDSPEAYQVLADRYGDKIYSLPREVYDRSAEQLKYALADLILLSRAPVLLGSGWSSFTEIAHRLSSFEQRLELSGQDF